MKKLIAILAVVLTLSLCLAACSQLPMPLPANKEAASMTLANGGVLCLKVNPEIAINYDNDGIVTGVTARNDDALKILAGYSFQGKQTKTVVSELVTAIGDAGYFVEEIDGNLRQITLEIEPGSALPSDVFLDEVVASVKAVVDQHQWTTPLNLEGTTDYGITDYVDTDYGPGNDGVTDYHHTDYGVTDYNDTDYGPNNDGVTDFGVTDYNDTDYGPNNDGVTDYHHTDYGKTDYHESHYGKTANTTAGATSGKKASGNTDYGKTDYDDTDYGPNNDGVTDYGKTDYGKTDYGKTDYDDGKTDYGRSDYGHSHYD